MSEFGVCPVCDHEFTFNEHFNLTWGGYSSRDHVEEHKPRWWVRLLLWVLR